MRSAHWSPGDAGCLGAFLSVLVFQSLRHDPFESEKLAFLVVCSVLMLIDLLHLPRASLRKTITQPLVMAALSLALITLISSVMALSPARAVFGSGVRSYGWIAVACQTLMIVYVAVRGVRLRDSVIPVLMLAAVPLCLLALYQMVTTAAPLRPGSMTGNPNYLAAWLGVCLAWAAPMGLMRIRSPQITTALFGVWALLVLIVLNATASRAAFIGLIFAAAAGLSLWGALRQSRLAAAIVLVLGLGLGGVLIAGQQRAAAPQGAGRLLEPIDDFRQAAWADSLSLIRQMPIPLETRFQQPDQWAAVRPLIGYGPENLVSLGSRLTAVRAVTSASIFVDRMHSLFYDTVLSTGLLGLLAQFALFELIWMALLRKSGLLASRRDGLLCGGLQAACVMGVGLISLLMGWTPGVALVMACLGLIVGLLVWLALRPAPHLVQADPWFIGLWCASIFYVVCHLFGFQTVAVSIVFAAAAGFCAEDTPEDEMPVLDGLNVIFAAALLTGISLVRSIPPLALIALESVLIGGGLLAMGLRQKRIPWQRLLVYSGSLGAIMIAGHEARVQIALSLNQTLLAAPNSLPSDLIVKAGLYSLPGLLCYGLAAVLLWASGFPRLLALTRLHLALLVSGLLVSGGIFILSSTAHILWNTGAALQSVSGAHYAADLSFEAAEQALPAMTDIMVDHLRFLRGPSGSLLAKNSADLEHSLETLDPFLNNAVR